MPTQRQLAQERLKGRTGVVLDEDSNPPPAMEIDPRFDKAFPEQAMAMRAWAEASRRWWTEFVIRRTKE